MRVLVSAASRHGATAELADRLGQALDAELRARRVESGVDVVAPEQVTGVSEYDAVVIGSAVYMGHWLDPARRLVETHAAELARIPVWLFSSGPVGDPLKPAEDPNDAAPMVEATGARDHRLFAGRLARSGLGFGEKAMVRALRVPDGDFRDWAAVAAWAADIAGILSTRPGAA